MPEIPNSEAYLHALRPRLGGAILDSIRLRIRSCCARPRTLNELETGLERAR